MTALHLVNHAAALTDCLEVAAPDDTVLLLEDGVYAAVAARAPDRALHALAADVRARGLESLLGAGVAVVDDAGFVRLVEAHQPIVTWR